MARWFSAIQPSVSRVVPYRSKWRCAFSASVWAADVAPNGICQLEVRAPPGGDILPSFISCWNVASHSVRKHSTWRAMPVATAIIAAITEPPGPKVSMPPLIHVGRSPSAPSSALTPPSPMPAMSSPG